MTPPPLTDQEKLFIMLTASAPGSLTHAMAAYRLNSQNRVHKVSLEDFLDNHWAFFAEMHHLYRHKKGGVYKVLGEAIAVASPYVMHDSGVLDGGPIQEQSVIVYEHVWPHERRWYVRPKAEFEESGRFVRIVE